MNLYRPGNHAQVVLIALGLGNVHAGGVPAQRSLVTEMMRSAPKDMPNVFLINVTEQERDGVPPCCEAMRGRQAEMHASARARIVAVDGVPISRVDLEEAEPVSPGQTVTAWRRSPSI
jgi:predicted lysophospholipase L1 biosynthesis ABC-type transport system permease subunit